MSPHREIRQNYIAYLDLLGTKRFAENAEDYHKKIEVFRDSLRLCVHSFSNAEPRGNRTDNDPLDTQVWIFSDSAYVETKKLSEMVHFMMHLRDVLLQEQLFFSAAITKGELGVVDPSADDLSLRKGILSGFAFAGNDAARVFVLQANFKGMGIYIDASQKGDGLGKTLKDEFLADPELKPLLVKSYFFPDAGNNGVDISGEIQPYWDLLLDYKANKVLEIILEECFSAYQKSTRAGRYYFSLMCNLINSYGESEELLWDSQTKSPQAESKIFKAVFAMLKRADELPYEYVLGKEVLGFLVVNKLYKRTAERKKNREIAEAIMDFPVVAKTYAHKVESIPDVFDKGLRELFMDVYRDCLSRKATLELLGEY